MSRSPFFFVVIAVIVGATGGCVSSEISSQGGSVRRFRPPRPVPTSQSWRGERPGYYTYIGFIRTSPRTPRPRASTCRVDLLLDGPPDLPYEVLGLITVEKVGPALVGLRGGEEQALGWIQTKACRVGATAVYDITTGSQWFEFRDRLVRSIRGTAVAVIYLPTAREPSRFEPSTSTGQDESPDAEQGRDGVQPPREVTPSVWLD